MKLSILIVGAGMYTCGRGTAGLGTILPSVIDFQLKSNSDHPIEKVVFAVRSQESKAELSEKINQAQSLFSIQLPFKIVFIQNDNYAELIQLHKINSVVIATPDPTHFLIAKQALESNANTLVVKPLTPDYSTSLQLANLADKNRLLGMVDFHKRFDLANVKIKDLIRGQNLGELDHIIVNYSQKRSIPLIHFKEWASTTNIFQYLGVHYADLIYFLTDATPLKIISTPSGNSLKNSGINCNDSIITHIQWATGKNTFQSVHFTSWNDPESSPAMSNQRIEFVGSKARLQSDQMNRGLNLYTETRGLEYINPYFSQTYLNYPGEATRCLGYGPDTYHSFFNCLLNDNFSHKKQGIPTFRDALTAAKIIDGSNKSLINGAEWVDIS